MKTIELVLVVAASAVAEVIFRTDKSVRGMMSVYYPNSTSVDFVNISQRLISVQFGRGVKVKLTPGIYVGVVRECGNFEETCDPPPRLVEIYDPKLGRTRPLVAFHRITVDANGTIHGTWSHGTSLIYQHEDNILERTIFFYNVTLQGKDFLTARPPYNRFPPAVACAKVMLRDLKEPAYPTTIFPLPEK